MASKISLFYVIYVTSHRKTGHFKLTTTFMQIEVFVVTKYPCQDKEIAVCEGQKYTQKLRNMQMVRYTKAGSHGRLMYEKNLSFRLTNFLIFLSISFRIYCICTSVQNFTLSCLVVLHNVI